MLDVLDKFGFVEPVHGSKPEVKLNKNFYPDENKKMNTYSDYCDNYAGHVWQFLKWGEIESVLEWAQHKGADIL